MLWMLLTFGLVIVILFNPTLSAALGRYTGFVLEPLLGHGPLLLTIFLASVVLVIATTAIRHFLVDWTKMARVQESMRAFQKEFMEARKSNNTYKLKKLTDAQPEVMAMQAEISTEQMKPMAFTMLLVIPIFAWLGAYVDEHRGDDPCGAYIEVPWNDRWYFGGTAVTREQCPTAFAKLFGWLTPFPHWIALYSLFGIPFGQLAQRALKLWEYRHVDLDADGVPAGKH
ncbi:MAG TPA: EMC3/TMCO1 family protein [Candidatus Thermoplasmatota archaeon]|nr:EMC3/TMCO1 family protein [Candidatus Thermoplasmatota archaeon]